MKFSFFLVFATLLFSSCSSISLDKYGKTVTLYESYLDAPSLGGYRSKIINCKQSVNMSSKNSNAESCNNYIRNAAGRMGATFVIIDRFQHKLPSGSGCLNCVNITGDAYIKKEKRK